MGWAGPVGVATGFAAWLVGGGASAKLDRLDAVEAQLQGLRPPAVHGPHNYANAGDLLSTPLFALTTGPGAVREPSVRVDGISLSARRAAALISIDGKTATWVRAGESVDAVTVQSVTAGSVTVETVVGVKTLNLGDQSAASGPTASAAQAKAESLPGPAQVPPSLRGPPEPASAPQR